MKNMKSHAHHTLRGIGSVLTGLLLAEEIFYLLAAAGLFQERIAEPILMGLIFAPFAVVWLYGVISVWAKTRRAKTVILAGVASLLGAAAVTAAYLIPGIGAILMLALCLVLAIAAILLAITGFQLASPSISYGILCMGAAYFAVNFFLVGMSTGSGTDNIWTAIWSMILIPFLCGLMITDLVAVRPYIQAPPNSFSKKAVSCTKI
ncbi:MAG: hypothetical protein ACLU8W_07560 [Clostridia bacterium]